MNYKELIEKIAKQMPYKTPDGNWAIPRGWEEAYTDDDDVEGTWENNYYRKEHKIPAHYKRIADSGWGDSVFVDTKSDEKNPLYAEFDHETGDLSEWDDKDRNRAYSLSDNARGREVAKLNYSDVRNADAKRLAGLGYDTKVTMKDRLNTLKSVGDAAIPGAVLGTALGLSTVQDSVRRAGRNGLIGAGIGAGITGAMGLIGTPSAKTRKLENARNEINKDYWDGKEDENFTNQYKPLEKKAGFFKNLNIGQKALGAATGAIIGAPLGYQLAKNDSSSNKVSRLRDAEDMRTGRKPIDTNFIKEDLGQFAASNSGLNNKLYLDYEDLDGISDSAKKSLAKRNIDTNNMKVKDYQSIIDRSIVDNYAGGKPIDGALSADDITRVNELADNILNNNNNTNNIEKKAFFTEALGTGLAAGLVGNGVGKITNGAHNVFTKQGRKDRKDYKRLIKDEGVMRTSDLSGRKYNYATDQFNEILKNNPDITMNEMSNELQKRYKEEMMR